MNAARTPGTRSTRRRFARLLLVALTFPGAGCAAVLTTLGGEPPVYGSHTTAGDGHRDVRVVIHCHTHRSHDSDGADEEIAAAAHATGTAVVLLTDHPGDDAFHSPPPANVDGILFIPGLEISRHKGAILALGHRGVVDTKLEPVELVRTLQERGAVAVLGHAERYRGEDVPDLDGYEVYNLHADAVNDRPLGVILRALVLPPGALFDSIMDGFDPQVTRRFDRMVRKRPRAAIAGNDSHGNVRLFGPAGGTIGTYEETFRVVATHVLVDGELTEQAVLDAIRAARTYVAFEAQASATGFTFVAEHEGETHPMGSSVPARSTLVVTAPNPEAEVKLRRNGQVLAKGPGSVRFEAVAPGSYRAEVTLDGEPWIFSSPIQVMPVQEEVSATEPAVAPAEAGVVTDVVR